MKMTPELAREILRQNGIEYQEKPTTNRSMAGEVARNLAAGASSLADPLAFIANLPTYAANAAFDINAEPPVYYPSQIVKEKLEKLSGIEGEPTTAQSVLGTASSLLGGGAGGKAALAARNLLFKGKKFKPGLIEKGTPTNIKEWAQLGGAGLGAGLGEQLSEDPLTKAGLGLLGGVTGGGLTKVATDIGAIKRGTQKQLGKVLGFSPESYEKFMEAKITPSLGEVTKSKAIKSVQNIFAELPGSAAVMEKFLAKRGEELEKVSSGAINKNTIQELEVAGDIIEKGAKAYNDSVRAQVSPLYDKAYAIFKPETPIPVRQVGKEIDKHLHAFSPEAKELIQNSDLGKRLGQLKKLFKDNENTTIPYHDIKHVYKPIYSDLIDTWGQVGTHDQAIYKNIVKTLDQSMKDAVLEYDPKAIKYFNEADKIWADFSKVNRKITNNLIKSTLPITKFNNVYNNLRRSNVRPLKLITEKLPSESKEELATTIINELGLNQQKDFSLETFHNNFNKLKAPAKAALLEGLPKKNANMLLSVNSALQETKGVKLQGNPSRSAYTIALWQIINDTTNALPGLGVSYLGAKKFTDPNFLKMLYEVGKRQSPDKAARTFNYYNNILNKELNSIQEAQHEADSKVMTPELAREILRQNGIE